MADDITDLRNTVWVITEVLGSCILLLLILMLIVLCHVRKLRTRLGVPESDSNQHAFQVPDIQPDEELAKRGYAQYGGSTDSFFYEQDQPDYSSIGNSKSTLHSANKY